MEVIEFIDSIGNNLEKSYLFRGLRFALGAYLLIMLTAVVLMFWRFFKVGYLNLLYTGQEFPVVKGKMQERWDESQERLKNDLPDEWKASVLEVSSMLAEILGVVGYSGETLGEKLDNLLPNQLDNLDQVKEANKIKNRIVQDEKFSISKEEAAQVTEVFGESLRYFEAIE